MSPALVRDTLLEELRAEWPDARWERDTDDDLDDLDELDTGARGFVSGRYVSVCRLGPGDALATEALQWEATSSSICGLGRTPGEAVQALLRRAS